jgi:nucleoid-associated protein YgaU
MAQPDSVVPADTAVVSPAAGAQSCPACGFALRASVSRCPECHSDLAAVQAIDELTSGLFDAALERARSGRVEEAVTTITAAIALSPQDAAAWVVLSKLRAQTGDSQGARACAQRAVAIDPENAGGLSLILALDRARQMKRRRTALACVLAVVVSVGSGWSVWRSWRASQERQAMMQRVRLVERVLRTLSDTTAAGVLGPLHGLTNLAVRSEPTGAVSLAGATPTPETRDLAVRVAATLTEDVGVLAEQLHVIAAPKPLPPVPLIHVVRGGDSLWNIAAQRLGQGRLWPRIAAANPGLEPARLPIGLALVVPVEGEEG